MRKALFLVIALLVGGCAIGRSYHPADNMWKLGYSDTQLNEKMYRVSYAGYGIPQNECDDFALMRAAQLAREKESRYFRVLTERHSSHSQSFYIPGPTQTTGTISGQTFSATTYTTAVVGTANYPVSTITIELAGNTSAADTLDAEVIWKSLSSRHGVSK